MPLLDFLEDERHVTPFVVESDEKNSLLLVRGGYSLLIARVAKNGTNHIFAEFAGETGGSFELPDEEGALKSLTSFLVQYNQLNHYPFPSDFEGSVQSPVMGDIFNGSLGDSQRPYIELTWNFPEGDWLITDDGHTLITDNYESIS